MPSSITSLQVLGNTVLPDGADAAIANGWVAVATFPDDGVSTFDPTKITLTVSDPGFTATGANTTVSRTITGTAIVRKQYPNNTSRLNSASGGVRTVYFALSDYLYTGTTITSATAASGFYGGAASGSIASFSTLSTRAYGKPQVGFLNLPGERSTSTFYVETVVGSVYARNGRQVACVQLFAKDSQATPNQTPTVTVSSTTLSTLAPNAPRPEVYAATLDCSALHQGDLCQVYAKVYPWIGSAPFDIAIDGTAYPTTLPDTPLRFVCDRAGTYGGKIYYVSPTGSNGNAGTQASPFATIGAALSTLVTYNSGSANPTHADHGGGIIRLMDNAGTPATHVLSSSGTTASGNAHTVIEADPSNTSTVKVSVTGSAISVTSMLRFKVPVQQNGGFFDGGDVAGKSVMFDGSTFDQNGATAPLNYRVQNFYFRNTQFLNFAGGNGNPFNIGYGNTRTGVAMCVGCSGTGSGAVSVRTPLLIGNSFSGVVAGADSSTSLTSIENYVDGAICYNNKFLAQPSVSIFAASRPITKGATILQNLFEGANNPGPALQISADDTTTAVANLNFAHNTIPASTIADTCARFNHLYADLAVGVQKTGIFKFNIAANGNNKTDVYQVEAPNVSGRTGNWSARYKVGWSGNVYWGDQNGGQTAPNADGLNWIGEYWAGVLTGAVTAFANNQSGQSKLGGGDYTPTGASNAAYSQVPSGAAVLAYDIVGNTRNNAGLGAAGAYASTAEQADTTPDAFSFTSQNNVELSTLVTSNTVTITGINGAASVTVVGGSWSKNGGAFTTASGSVVLNDTVTVQHTSSANYATSVTTTLTVGGVAGTFTSTTVTANSTSYKPVRQNNVLVEVSPIKPDGSTTTLRMARGLVDSSGSNLNGQFWHPVIYDGPKRTISVFDNDNGETKQIETSHGTLSFVLDHDFGTGAWSTYSWEGAYAKIWVGFVGDSWSSYTQIFEGRVGPLQRRGQLVQISLLGPEADLNTNLLTGSYGGTGGSGGNAGIKGNLKPWCSGSCQNVAPVLVDPVYWVYQTHGYGAVHDIPNVYEQALPLGTSAGDAASYAALIGLSLSPGQWATCKAEGMFRLASEPKGKITADCQGALNAGTYVATVGTIAEHLLIWSGVSPSKIDATSLEAFSQAWGFYTTEQVTVGDIVRDAFAQAGGYLLASSTAVWKAGNYFTNTVPTALSATGLITDYAQIPTAPPAYRVKVGSDRCFSVHSDGEISTLYQDIEEGRVVGYLTNENVTLAADASGNVSDFSSASGTFKLEDGGTDQTGTGTVTYARGTQTNCTATIDLVTGVYSVSAMSADTASVIFTASYGTYVIPQTFTLSKSRAGADGTPAKLVTLTSDRQTITYDYSGTLSPAGQTTSFTLVEQGLPSTSIKLALAKIDGTPVNANSYLTGTGTITDNGDNTFTQTGTTFTMSASNFDIARGGTKGVIVTSSVPSAPSIKDQISVVQVQQGPQGQAAPANVTGYLTNEAQVVVADKDGNVASFASAGGTFRVFNGTAEVTGSSAFSLVTQTGVAVSINATSGVYSVSSMSADQGTATLQAVYGVAPNAVTITAVYSIAKSKAGLDGTPAKFIAVEATGQAIKFDATNTVVASQRIDFTARRAGTTATTNWEVYRLPSGTAISPAGILSVGSGDTTYLTGSSFASGLTGSDTGLRIRGVLTDGSFSDSISVLKLNDGATGVSALVGFLTNEDVTLPADNAGNVTNYGGASGNFEVFLGTTDVTASCTFAPVASSGGITTSSFNSSGAYAVTALSSTQDNFWWDLGATYTPTGQTITKRFTISKSKAGATGATPPLLTLSADSFVFDYDQTGTIVTRTITFKATRNATATAQTSWNLRDKTGTSLGTWTASGIAATGYFSRVDDDTLTMSSAQYLTFRGTDTNRDSFSLVASSSGGTADKVSVNRLLNGNDGTLSWTPVLNTMVRVGSTFTRTGGSGWSGTPGTVSFVTTPLVGSVERVSLARVSATVSDTTSFAMVALSDGTNVYTLYRYPTTGTILLWEQLGTTQSTVLDTGVALSLNQSLELVHTGTVIEAYINGAKVGQFAGIVGTTTFSLWLNSSNSPTFSNVTFSRSGASGSTSYNLVAQGVGTVSTIGSTIVATNGNSDWSLGAYSVESYSTGAYVSARAGETNTQKMFGLNRDPLTDASYSSLDYAWYLHSDGNAYAYESGGNAGGFGAYSTTDDFAIIHDATKQTVSYYKNKVVQRTVTGVTLTSGQAFSFDSSFVTSSAVKATFTNVAFGPAGSAGVPGINAKTMDITASKLDFSAYYTGVIKDGQQPKQFRAKSYDGGTEVSSSTAWTVTGTGCTATVDSTGLITVDSVTASGTVVVGGTYSGFSFPTKTCTISKNLDPAPPQTSGTVTLALNAAINTTSYPAVPEAGIGSGTVVTNGAGGIKLSANLTWSVAQHPATIGAPYTLNVAGQFYYRPSSGGTWTTIGSEVAGQQQAQSTYNSTDHIVENVDGSLTMSQSFTLSASTSYDFTVALRVYSGNQSSALSPYGSMTAAQP